MYESFSCIRAVKCLTQLDADCSHHHSASVTTATESLIGAATFPPAGEDLKRLTGELAVFSQAATPAVADTANNGGVTILVAEDEAHDLLEKILERQDTPTDPRFR